ncbi:hypothetical protein [Pseudomonas sp. NFPP28]|uniref:hypothetical protein n=1 Tax=Pseudomonas sp. NFPP28 TaxID=1566231 RepID=UPI001113F7AE|nr:hypothetical protein [Pseudomonas sp. NFPP28]
MEKYYHDVDTLAFQHQVHSISKEMSFRLNELIDASRSEISKFNRSIHLKGQVEDEQTDVVAYRFGSFLALLQTFRDALNKAVGEDIDQDSLFEGVPHASFLFQLRNALVHDGYQAVSLWVDGRYYFPVNIKRQGFGKKIIYIDAPVVDVETLTLQYALIYSQRLAALIDKLPAEQKLKGCQRSGDWYRAAFSHSEVKRLLGDNVLGEADFSFVSEPLPVPLDLAVGRLREITKTCADRLDELERLSPIPFD